MAHSDDELLARVIDMLADIQSTQRETVGTVDAIQSDVQKLRGEVRSCRGEVTALSGKVEALSGNVIVLAASAEVLEECVAKHDTRFDSIERSLGGLTQLTRSTYDVVESVIRGVNEQKIRSSQEAPERKTEPGLG